MHHDAITGTHTKITEKNYYKLLKEANFYLTKASRIINHNFGLEADPTVVNNLIKTGMKLKNPAFDHYTIVNPTADFRSEVLNMTLTASLGENDTYAVFVHFTNGTFKSKNVYNNL